MKALLKGLCSIQRLSFQKDSRGNKKVFKAHMHTRSLKKKKNFFNLNLLNFQNDFYLYLFFTLKNKKISSQTLAKLSKN